MVDSEGVQQVQEGKKKKPNQSIVNNSGIASVGQYLIHWPMRQVWTSTKRT